MESLAEANLAVMQRFQLLQQFESSEPVDEESGHWPKDLFLAQFDRFELWAVNLGVFVKGHGSLDYRIRDSESMKDVILKMVKNLTRSLDEVLDYLNGDREQDDDDVDAGSDTKSAMESDMDLLLDSVKDPIDRLYKMAVWIRNPAARLPSSKARRFQQIDDETKVDLFKSFETFDYDYISSLFLQYEKDRALQEKPTIRYQGEFDDTDGQDQVWEPIRTVSEFNKLRIANGTESYLIHRIVQANGRRRQQFAYWRSHKDKLRKHAAVAVEAPRHKLPNTGHQMGGGKETTAKAPLTVTTATQLRPLSGEEEKLFEKANALNHVASEYAPSAWEPSKDIVSFPLPPRVPATEQFFECPYCYTICPASLLSEKAWRAHLIRDLRPYVCTFQDCSISDQLYDSRDDWIQHEVSAHQTIYRCPRHQDDTFGTAEAYERHMQEHCQGETLSLSLAKSTPVNIQRSCPVCSIVLQTTQKLQSHIALHLERFALFTLPRSTDDTDKEELEVDSTRAPIESNISLDGYDIAESAASFTEEDVNTITNWQQPQMPMGMADHAGRGMGPNQQAMGMPGGPNMPMFSDEMARLGPADRAKVNELATELMNRATEQQLNSARLHMQSRLSAQHLAELHTQAQDPLVWWYQLQTFLALRQSSLNNRFQRCSAEMRALKQSLEDVFAMPSTTHDFHFFVTLERLQSQLKILHGNLVRIWSLASVPIQSSLENFRRSSTVEAGEICITAGLLEKAIESFEHLESFQASQFLPSDPESLRTRQQIELVYEVINALQEVRDALGLEVDLHTEPGKSMALEKLARTALGAHHAETIWGPTIRKEISKIMAGHGTAINDIGTEERIYAATLTKQMSEQGQASTGRDPDFLTSEDPTETGEDSSSFKALAGTQTSDAFSPEGQQTRNSLAKQDQGSPAPQRGDKDGGWLTTATPILGFEELATDYESAASETMSLGRVDAQEGLVHKDRVSWKLNRDEYSQPKVSFDFGKFSDQLAAEGEGDALTTTDDPGKPATKADQQLQEDPEMEEEKDQVEKEMELFKHIFHPLWVAARLERQLWAKATRTRDTGGELFAHQLEMDLRAYRDDVGELENQFLTEFRKAERSKKAQLFTTKMRSFNWQAVEERLEEIRLNRRARLREGEEEEARHAQTAQEHDKDDTQMAGPEDDLTREPRQIRIVEREDERDSQTSV
ncbi:hypothetical protein MKX07_000436 [Trichoderma sp. CBMAI-0711]|nr:hypothetical protein MKX07_000436 [Trichoderma sp. CBMAI-0711]